MPARSARRRCRPLWTTRNAGGARGGIGKGRVDRRVELRLIDLRRQRRLSAGDRPSASPASSRRAGSCAPATGVKSMPGLPGRSDDAALIAVEPGRCPPKPPPHPRFGTVYLPFRLGLGMNQKPLFFGFFLWRAPLGGGAHHPLPPGRFLCVLLWGGGGPPSGPRPKRGGGSRRTRSDESCAERSLLLAPFQRSPFNGVAGPVRIAARHRSTRTLTEYA